MTASAGNPTRSDLVFTSAVIRLLLQVIRHQGGDEFRSCALRLFSRLEWSHSPPIGSIGGVLDDITELRTFVRIVAACPPPPRRAVFRLVLLASGWRCWSFGPKCSFSPPAPVQTSRAHPD